METARPRSDEHSTSLRTNHGGVCLFFRDFLKVSRILFDGICSFEVTCARITGPQFSATFAVVYRPGSSAVTDLFFSEFSDLLQQIAVSSTPVFVVGDLNIHLDVVDDAAALKVLDILSTHSLTRHITQSTHNRGHTLDVLITRHDQAVTSVNVDPPSLSDHSMIVANVNLHAPPAFTVTRLPRRSWRSLDVDKFAEDMRHSTLMQTPPSDVNELFQCYNETLRSLVDIHTPLRMVSCWRGPRSAHWYDGECRKEKAKTRRLERVYRRCLTSEAQSCWRQQSSLLRKLLQHKASQYWSTAISSCNGDSKSL